MSERKLPREEPFMAHNPAQGLSKPIRDLTDQELAEAIQVTEQQNQAAGQALNQALNQAVQVARIKAIFEFESDRRRKSITIVHDLKNLRRQ